MLSATKACKSRLCRQVSLVGAHHSGTVFLVLLLTSSTVLATPIDRDILQQAGIPADKAAHLLQGNVVSHELQEASDKEMALSTAIYIKVDPAVVSDFITQGEMAAIDPDIIAYAEIPVGANGAAFERFAFNAKQHREVDYLLDDDVRESFNLSAGEIASFSDL